VSSPSAPAGRDPRRSLLIGSAIAGVILLCLFTLLLIAVALVFGPRRAGRDSLGPAPAIATAAIHPVPVAAP
jgi:hypothetical protein